MGVFAFLLAIAISGQAFAQQSAPLRPQPPAPPPAPKAGECALLPGGNAPVNRIADLAQPLSPRSLDLTYFNKRLADLTEEDFERIADIATKCNRTQARVAVEKTRQLRDVIRESQAVLRQTLNKVDQGKANLSRIKNPREKVEWLNNAWTELPLLADAITRTDLREYAGWIARSLQAVYDDAPGYGKRPPPTAAEVLGTVPQKTEQISAATRAEPDAKGPLPGRPWWTAQRSREDE
jgi:flagellar biosynthesis/type III secretory pathway chaperone